MCGGSFMSAAHRKARTDRGARGPHRHTRARNLRPISSAWHGESFILSTHQTKSNKYNIPYMYVQYMVKNIKTLEITTTTQQHTRSPLRCVGRWRAYCAISFLLSGRAQCDRVCTHVLFYSLAVCSCACCVVRVGMWKRGLAIKVIRHIHTTTPHRNTHSSHAKSVRTYVLYVRIITCLSPWTRQAAGAFASPGNRQYFIDVVLCWCSNGWQKRC